MFSWQDIIIYIALAAIVYFLIKAFAANKIKETYIILLTLFIVIIFIAITSNKFTCKNNNLEGFQNTDKGIVESVYDGPNNDNDLNNMKNVMGLDKEIYNRLKENEIKAMDNIRSKYKYDMVHTTSHPFNTVPLGTQLYGYTYLPPENWFRPYEQPPVCAVNQSRIESTPDAYINGLLEFDASNNTMGAMGINHGHIKNITQPLSK
jgi:hypothetical protein